MIKGIGNSRSGMVYGQMSADVIANNVANVNTDGFRRSMAVAEEQGQLVLRRIGDQQGGGPRIGTVGNGVATAEIAVDQRGGILQESDNPFDMVLAGPGEFTVQTAAGIAYTRDGRFQRDATGQLVTATGQPVLVSGVPVGVGASLLEIAEDGTVQADGQPLGRLDLRGSAPDTRVRSGWVETSNVELAQEMTDLIVALRAFQINQRALQVQDQTLAKAISDLPNL